MDDNLFDDVVFDVDRERYNAFVQLVQSEATSFRMEHRRRPIRVSDDRLDGSVEVFWERWHEVASETRAMTPECARRIHPARWENIKAQAAHELLRS